MLREVGFRDESFLWKFFLCLIIYYVISSKRAFNRKCLKALMKRENCTSITAKREKQEKVDSRVFAKCEAIMKSATKQEVKGVHNCGTLSQRKVYVRDFYVATRAAFASSHPSSFFSISSLPFSRKFAFKRTNGTEDQRRPRGPFSLYC